MANKENRLIKKLLAEFDEDPPFLNQMGEAFVRLRSGEAVRVLPVRSQEVRAFLINRAYEMTARLLPAGIIDGVLSLVESRTRSSGRKVQMENRFARLDKTIYLDLADESGRAAKVEASGWKIVTPRRVMFERQIHQATIPLPRHGGDLEKLFKLLAISRRDHRLLITGWLATAIATEVPCPVLVLFGPHGSGKSTRAKLLRALIDPSKIETVPLSRNPAELAQILQQHATPVFDNQSSIKRDVSDMLCSAVTGAGFTKKKLYSNKDNVLFEYKRAMIMTSINIPSTAHDLLDRFLLIELEPPRQRRTEEDINREFKRAQPAILGGLLDTLVKVLGLIDDVRIPNLPRLADFARWGTAMALALGNEADAFMKALAGNDQRRVDAILEDDPIADAVQRFLSQNKRWSGTGTQLLRALIKMPNVDASSPDWPKQANKLSARLRELQSPLKEIGIELKIGRHKASRKIWLSYAQEKPNRG